MKKVLIIFLQELMNLLQKTIQLMMMNLDILKYIQVWLLDQLILFEQQEISMEMNGLVMYQFFLRILFGMERYDINFIFY